MKSSIENKNLIEKVDSIENKVNTIDSRLVTVEKKVYEIDNRLINVENKVCEIDVRLVSVENKIVRISNILGEHSVQFVKLESFAVEAKERLDLIPRMYDILDGFAMETEASRMERVVVSHQMSAYDKRFDRLEKAIKSKKL